MAAGAKAVLSRLQDWLAAEQREKQRLEESISTARDAAQNLVTNATQRVYQLRNRIVVTSSEAGSRKKTVQARGDASQQPGPNSNTQQEGGSDGQQERATTSASVPKAQPSCAHDDRPAADDTDGQPEAGPSSSAAPSLGKKRGRPATRAAASTKRSKAQAAEAAVDDQPQETAADATAEVPPLAEASRDQRAAVHDGEADTAAPMAPQMSQADTSASQQDSAIAEGPRRRGRPRKQQAGAASQPPAPATQQPQQLGETAASYENQPNSPPDALGASAPSRPVNTQQEDPADLGASLAGPPPDKGAAAAADVPLQAQEPKPEEADVGAGTSLEAREAAAGSPAPPDVNAPPLDSGAAAGPSNSAISVPTHDADMQDAAGSGAFEPEAAPADVAAPSVLEAGKERQEQQVPDAETNIGEVAPVAAPVRAVEPRVTRSRRAAAAAGAAPSAAAAAPAAAKAARGRATRQKRDMKEAQLGSPGLHPKTKLATGGDLLPIAASPSKAPGAQAAAAETGPSTEKAYPGTSQPSAGKAGDQHRQQPPPVDSMSATSTPRPLPACPLPPLALAVKAQEVPPSVPAPEHLPSSQEPRAQGSTKSPPSRAQEPSPLPPLSAQDPPPSQLPSLIAEELRPSPLPKPQEQPPSPQPSAHGLQPPLPQPAQGLPPSPQPQAEAAASSPQPQTREATPSQQAQAVAPSPQPQAQEPPPSPQLREEAVAPPPQLQAPVVTPSKMAQEQAVTPSPQSPLQEPPASPQLQAQEATASQAQQAQETQPSPHAPVEALAPSSQQQMPEATPSPQADKQAATPSPQPLTREVTPSPQPLTREVTPSPQPLTREVTPSPQPLTREVTPSPQPHMQEVTATPEVQEQEPQPSAQMPELPPSPPPQMHDTQPPSSQEVQERSPSPQPLAQGLSPSRQPPAQELPSSSPLQAQGLAPSPQTSAQEPAKGVTPTFAHMPRAIAATVTLLSAKPTSAAKDADCTATTSGTAKATPSSSEERQPAGPSPIARNNSTGCTEGGFCFGVNLKEQSSPNVHFGHAAQPLDTIATASPSHHGAAAPVTEEPSGSEKVLEASSPLAIAPPPMLGEDLPGVSSDEDFNAASGVPPYGTVEETSEALAMEVDEPCIALVVRPEARHRSLSLSLTPHAAEAGPADVPDPQPATASPVAEAAAPELESAHRESALAERQLVDGSNSTNASEDVDDAGDAAHAMDMPEADPGQVLEQGGQDNMDADMPPADEAPEATIDAAGDGTGDPVYCPGVSSSLPVDATDCLASGASGANAPAGAACSQGQAAGSQSAGGVHNAEAADTGSTDATQFRPKVGNIVACVRSFLPMQGAPSPLPAAGKKPVKVKALEAAQAAKQKEAARAAERAQARAAASDRRQAQAETAHGNGPSNSRPPAVAVPRGTPTRPAGRPDGRAQDTAPSSAISKVRQLLAASQATFAARTTPGRPAARPDAVAPAALASTAAADGKRNDGAAPGGTVLGSVKARAALFEQVKQAAADQSNSRRPAPAAGVAVPTYKAGAHVRAALAAGNSEVTLAAAAVAPQVSTTVSTASVAAPAPSGTRAAAAAPAAAPAETAADKHKRVELKRREEEERRRAELEARVQAKDDKLRNFEATKQQQRLGGGGAASLLRPAPSTVNPLAVQPAGKRPPLNNGGVGAGPSTSVHVKQEQENHRVGPVGPSVGQTPGPKAVPAASSMASPAVQMQVKLLSAVQPQGGPSAGAHATASKARVAPAITTACGVSVASAKPALLKPPPSAQSLKQKAAAAAANASQAGYVTPGGANLDLTEEDRRNVLAIQNSPYIEQVKPRTPAAATASKKPLMNYQISPYRESGSDDEDEQETQPKKPVPEWAQPSNILEAVRSQSQMDADAIFGACPKTIDIIKVFAGMPHPGPTDARGKPRRDYRRRGSSGNWEADR